LLCFTRALTRFYPDPGPKPAKILEIDGFFEVHSPWDFVAENMLSANHFTRLFVHLCPTSSSRFWWFAGKPQKKAKISGFTVGDFGQEQSDSRKATRMEPGISGDRNSWSA
jgi:hypothetical protein